MIPSGWYYVAQSRDIAPSQKLRLSFFNTSFVLWRTESGKLFASDVACPHRGTDLGVHGKVVGERLECFSHGYSYNEHGDCVAPKARLRVANPKSCLKMWEVDEVGGFVVVWFDSNGSAPSWRLEEELFNSQGKGRYVKSQYEFDTTVEQINEDNFDVGHLYRWHLVDEVKSTKPLVDNHTISITHDFKRHSLLFHDPLPGPLTRLSVEVQSRYSSTLYGPGLTYSKIELPQVNFSTQDMIWITPISDSRVQYTTFLRREYHVPQGIKDRLITRLLHPVLFPAFVWRLRGEHRHEGHGFWENQHVVGESTLITEKEKTMLEPYWLWCKQFH